MKGAHIMDDDERFDFEESDEREKRADRYWKEFVRTGKVKDYLRYALGLRDE